ncbi:hypothetical protein B0H67DRAFT_645396 [Lasiosphaeris hirsuta]|uniref:DUF2415 domain-containing protein n=1 Tax=Lasiosphaeris hirsuta TaxID=260670 RepID=A0AA40DU60_9PEZI|nr:hypothetical protein B0H67DRAFT_645396 [Lasiosphaeris hirsuta]
MAVEHDDYVPTEDLILSKPRRHFRTTVHAIHWQLRSIIGVENQNLVYYPTGDQNKNIQRLNTTTRETETIKRLPFSPRCLVAERGWVCCGGESGEFAVIKVGEDSPQQSDTLEARLSLDPDERLPLDLGSSRTEDVIFLSLARARSNKSLLAESKKFGKELVNCITLWFLPTLNQPHVGAYSEPTAVLSNNDKTVALIRLQDQEVLDELTYPDHVNRAVISPDGRLLIAITDDPYLYVHERAEKVSGPFRPSDRPVYQWSSCGRVHLKSQRKDDLSNYRGSFAACFSGTGKYLAVGTQYGSISIFSVAALTVPGLDPLLTCFASTRPSSDHGAVRDMTFAPGSMDLLAWTEDRARVGIADLRNGFVSRQIVSLDRIEEYEHISVGDRSTIDPRLLEQRGEDHISVSSGTSLDLSPSDLSLVRQTHRESLARYYTPLTPDETLVLEALQEHRRRQEQREQREQRAAGQAGNGTGPRSPWAERSTRSGLPPDTSARSRERSASVSRVVNDIMGSIRNQREQFRDQSERLRDQTERLRGPMREDNVTTERRRAPVPPSSSTSLLGQYVVGIDVDPINTRVALFPLTTDTSNSERRGLAARLAAIDNVSPTNPAPVPTQAPVPPTASSGWDSGEAVFNPSSFTRRNTGNTNNNSNDAENNNNASDSGRGGTGGYRPLTAAERRENLAAQLRPDLGPGDASLRRRDRAAYLMREWEENPTRRSERLFARETVSADPHDTSGLAWGDGGQVLYVGADDGIYELHVNLLGRKLFPSIELR